MLAAATAAAAVATPSVTSGLQSQLSPVEGALSPLSSQGTSQGKRSSQSQHSSKSAGGFTSPSSGRSDGGSIASFGGILQKKGLNTFERSLTPVSLVTAGQGPSFLPVIHGPTLPTSPLCGNNKKRSSDQNEYKHNKENSEESLQNEKNLSHSNSNIPQHKLLDRRRSQSLLVGANGVRKGKHSHISSVSFSPADYLCQKAKSLLSQTALNANSPDPHLSSTNLSSVFQSFSNLNIKIATGSLSSSDLLERCNNKHSEKYLGKIITERIPSTQRQPAYLSEQL